MRELEEDWRRCISRDWKLNKNGNAGVKVCVLVSGKWNLIFNVILKGFENLLIRK